MMNLTPEKPTSSNQVGSEAESPTARRESSLNAGIPDTRYTLLGKLQNPADSEAWAEFAAIYQPLILRIAKSKGLQHADATDVTQEVLAKVASVIDRFEERTGSSFRGWLYRVTRNLVVDFLRKQGRGPLYQVLDPEEILAMDPQAEASAEFQLEFEKQVFFFAAQSVRQSVQPNSWLAFWRTEMDRAPVADVARELEMSPGAVYVARSRVLAKLKSVAEERTMALSEKQES